MTEKKKPGAHEEKSAPVSPSSITNFTNCTKRSQESEVRKQPKCEFASVTDRLLLYNPTVFPIIIA